MCWRRVPVSPLSSHPSHGLWRAVLWAHSRDLQRPPAVLLQGAALLSGEPGHVRGTVSRRDWPCVSRGVDTRSLARGTSFVTSATRCCCLAWNGWKLAACMLCSIPGGLRASRLVLLHSWARDTHTSSPPPLFSLRAHTPGAARAARRRWVLHRRGPAADGANGERGEPGRWQGRYLLRATHCAALGEGVCKADERAGTT